MIATKISLTLPEFITNGYFWLGFGSGVGAVVVVVILVALFASGSSILPW
jgi:hypothetical protein